MLRRRIGRSRPDTAPCGRWGTTRPWRAEVIPELGPVLVAGEPVCARGDRVLDVGAGSGNAAVAAALTGAAGRGVGPDARAVRRPAGRSRRPARGRRWSWEEGDAEALPYAERRVRRRAVVRGRDVRPAPPAGGRRAGPGVPPGRHGSACSAGRRRGSSGEMFAHDEAVRASAAARGAAAAAAGRRRTDVRALLGDRVSDVGRPPADAWSVGRATRRRRRGGTSGSGSTGRRSRRSAASRATPSGSPRLTTTLPPSPRGTTTAPAGPSLTGSTSS